MHIYIHPVIITSVAACLIYWPLRWVVEGIIRAITKHEETPG